MAEDDKLVLSAGELILSTNRNTTYRGDGGNMTRYELEESKPDKSSAKMAADIRDRAVDQQKLEAKSTL